MIFAPLNPLTLNFSLFPFSDFDEIIVAIRASPVFRPGHMGFCVIKFHQIHADLSYFSFFYLSDFDEIIVAIRVSPVFGPGHMGFCFIKLGSLLFDLVKK